MICKYIEFSRDMQLNVVMSLTLTNQADLETIPKLKPDDLIDVTVKKHRNKRSHTANSYMWVLLDKLAIELQTTKVELYQRYIKLVGKFESIPLKKEAVDGFLKAWEGQGLGNVGEVFRESSMDGYMVVRAYYGSSTYDTKEMARLIDHIVADCKEQRIETMPPDEIERLYGNG